MGEDRPYSEIELRRLAKQQRSPEFRAWLDREADDLAQLLVEIPALRDLDDPWTVAGFDAIENAAMQRLPNPGPTVTDEEMDYLALCARGIGHIFLRRMGVGKWVWVNLYEGLPTGPAIEFPGHSFWTDPGQSIRNVVFDRKPGVLATELEGLAAWSREAPKYSLG
ncbi:hypothetical protein [Nocardia ignorata]|uniref:DUF3806 domain-containing protein n=1 Tax=Nocardia ignorata TaxID=145285 RepID=A0A4R6NZV6_NOCIG|nr:hypothetical protein [Nocardia ignorata]TDP29857.1 hypothetical protein DFR75_112126 [Nocardia ignorata]